MHLALKALSLASLQACHLNKKKKIFQINTIGLKIPTGGRQTSWLCTKRDGGSELGTTEQRCLLQLFHYT